jgi:hypothetical protein
VHKNQQHQYLVNQLQHNQVQVYLEAQQQLQISRYLGVQQLQQLEVHLEEVLGLVVLELQRLQQLLLLAFLDQYVFF